MKPITPQQVAHLRLLSALPVRTHQRVEKPLVRINVSYMTPEGSAKLKAWIRELSAQGKKTKEIMAICGCSDVTVYNHLRKR
jgi:hypothetical protein